MIVRKSVKMAAMLKAPVLGMVENMRSLVCPGCGERVELFDDGGAGAAERLGIPLLASLPWRAEVARARSIRWSALSEAARRDADTIADAVILAGGAPPAASGADMREAR